MPASDSTAQRSARKPGRNLPAEHSGRIVYADPRSLPSYPTVGVKLDSTNLAAIQASQTKSPPAIYSSGPVSSASLKAATAAAAAGAALHVPARPAQASQNTPVAESSEASMPSRPPQRRHHQRNASASGNFSPAPSVSSMSAKAPVDTSTWGNSAATQAFRNSQVSQASRATAPPPKPIPEIAALGPQPSLRAAVGAMKVAPSPSPSLRPRHKSNSTSSLRHQKSLSSHYPEGVSAGQASSSAANALKAATAATKARSGDRSSLYLEGGSVPYTTMGRQMYTSHPHIGPEHDNEAHEKMLHESAVAMAKKMYNPQANSQASSTAGVAGPGGTQGTNLQEAAYKLAQARLEALHEKYGKDREFRDYYVDPKMGSSSASSAGFSRRFSMRDRLRRRRSSSDSDMTEERSTEIRNQMDQVSGKISAAETKKREDRQNVLLAAQRNVKSQLHDIDEKVYSNSGRVPPGTLSSWESKAHSVAQDRANAQLSMYPRADQVDIGGGTFVPRTQVDKIAARNVQPVIDDMHEKAQAERERQETVRKEQEDQKAEAAQLKARDKELKELKKKLKQEEKEKKKAAKAEEKASKVAKKRGSFMAGKSKNSKDSDTKDTGIASKPVAAIIPEAPTHQSNRDEHDHEVTDSEVMTAPDTTSSVRETHDVETPSPTTEPEHSALATEPVSKAREPVSPVSPGSPLSPVSPEARTSWVAPAAVVTAAGAIPAVIVGKTSTASPSAETSAPVSAPEPASSSQASPVSAAATAHSPSSSHSQLDPPAAPFLLPSSTASSTALPRAPSTPFTEPRDAPAVPSTPPAVTSSGFAFNAPTSHLYSAFPSPPKSPASSTRKAATAPYSPPTSEFSTPKTGTTGTAGGAQETRSGRRLSNLFVKTPSRDAAPPKPIEYSEIDHEHRKNAAQGTAVGPIGAVGAFGGTGAVGSDFVSRVMNKPAASGTSTSPTNNASGSRLGTSAMDKSPPTSATPGNESSTPRRNSKVKTWFAKFSRSGSKSGATDSGSVPASGAKAKDTTYSAAGTDANAKKTFVGGHALTSAENVSASGSGTNRAANNGTTDSIKNGKSPAMGSGGLNISAMGDGPGGFSAGNSASKAPGETDKSGLPDTGVPMDRKDGLNPGLLDVTGKSRTGVVSEANADDKCPHVPLGTTVEAVTSGSSPTTRDFHDVSKQPKSSTSGGHINGSGSYPNALGGTAKGSASGANEPGDRASYVSYGSSNYNDDGAAATSGARGATGSSNTFVTVPPPTTAPSTVTAGTASGESGIDTAYTLPKTLRDPAYKKSASPVRDSRFLENLEDKF